MKAKVFNEIVDEVLDKARQTLTTKSAEYSSKEDKLSNFKMPCSIMDMNPAEVCLAYDMKHIASLSKIAKDINKEVYPSDELLLEKVQDYVNYGILFKAIVTELKRGGE